MSFNDQSGSRIERIGALDAGGKEDFLENFQVLKGELEQSTLDASWYYQRCERAYHARMCHWAGQSEDGRKHGSDIGNDAFPWEGASDERPHTIDATVNEQVMIMVQAFMRANTQAVANDTDYLEWAEQLTVFLKYMIWTRMRPQIRREVDLAAHWRQMYGCSITSIMWDQQMRRMTQEITTEGLAAMISQSDDPNVQAVAHQKVLEQVMNPDFEEENLRILMSFSPILKKGAARRCLQELRQKGSTEIPVPEVFAAMPRWQALLPFVDIFFGTFTDDIQRAPWVAHRELITESDLRDRINTQGYDADWVEEACKHKGVVLDSLTSNVLAYADHRRNFWGMMDHERRDLIEIFHYYRKSIDDDGLPQVWNTVLCLKVNDMVGLDEPLGYEHGMYPYVVHQREHIFRTILESRGVGMIGDSWQREIKAQIDARTDRTSITVLPPILVPPSRGASKLTFGPGTKWPARRGEDVSFLEIPPGDGSSIEIEQSAQKRLDQYFGRISDLCPEQLTQLHQQALTDGWLLELQQMISMTLQLCRQYMTDDQVSRIVGDLPFPWQASQSEIEGCYDISIEFDARDLNPEALKAKLGLVEQVLQLDRFGQVDYSKLVPLLFRSIDPHLARAVLQPMSQATQSQVSDEQNALTQMVAGIEPPMQPQPGMNYALRLQTLQQAIQGNPELQQMIAARPILSKMVGNRVKFLQFQQQQLANAQTGRIGTTPVLPQQQPQLQQGPSQPPNQ